GGKPADKSSRRRIGSFEDFWRPLRLGGKLPRQAGWREQPEGVVGPPRGSPGRKGRGLYSSASRRPVRLPADGLSGPAPERGKEGKPVVPLPHPTCARAFKRRQLRILRRR